MANRIVYFVDATSGHLFRCRHIHIASPIYEDLGLVDAGGLYWIALDEFDKENRAMVCGPAGVWSTSDLNADTPTWVLELTPQAGFEFMMVRSSPLTDGVWMAVEANAGARPRIYVTVTDGVGWNWYTLGVAASHEIKDTGIWLEWSKHDDQRAWATWYRQSDGSPYVVRTTNLWASHTMILGPVGCLRGTAYVWEHAPPIFHRVPENEDDQHALWGGQDHSASPYETNIMAYDHGAETCVTLCSSAVAYWHAVKELGCDREDTTKYWTLAWCTSTARFNTSDDEGQTWDIIHTFGGGEWHRHACDSPDDDQHFIVTNDGATHPLSTTEDRGETWENREGNWADLGYAGNIRCVAVGIISHYYGLTPEGGGLYPQSLACDPDGGHLYICVYDVATGNPILIRAELPLAADSLGLGVFDPGDGDAINVATAAMGGRLAIAGNFAAAGNEQVEVSTDFGGAWSDIDRDAWGVEVAQPLLVGDDINHVMVALQTAQDLTETIDGGSTPWLTRNAALGFAPTAMARLGDEMIIGDGAGSAICYSPSRGQTLHDITGLFIGIPVALELI